MNNAELVRAFISQVWNNRDFAKVEQFLHPLYHDHSLLPKVKPDLEGTILWIKATGQAFEHETEVVDLVAENDTVMVRIKMNLKHVGAWRGIEPTGMMLETNGFRQFRIEDGKIIEHWALVDGETIQNQLDHAARGCEVGK